jgi:hypothetical protein
MAILWRTLLASMLVCAGTATAAEHYGRWEWHDFGEHLPYNWEYNFGVQADFSGLVGGGIDPDDSDEVAVIFDVHTGELRELGEPGGEWVNALAGGWAVVNFYELHNLATGDVAFAPSGIVQDIASTGQAISYADRRSDELGERHEWQSLVVIDASTGEVVQEIDPPGLYDPFPGSGLTLPAGYLEPRAISPGGTFAAGGYALPGEEGAFVADLTTGQLAILPGSDPFVAVNDHGQGSSRTWSAGSGLQFPAAINNAGQAYPGLAIDDEGRVLRLVNGPVVLVPFPDDPDIISEYQTQKIQIGLPLAIAGDYNASGGVEQGDLDVVLSSWGKPVSELPAGWVHDVPTEGLIDQADLDEVLSRWGATDGPIVAGLPEVGVPEPSTLGLLVGVLALCGVRTRQRRKSAARSCA